MPNKWIAAVLGFFIQPLGMLYVVQVKWAFIYFGLSIVISLSEYIGIHTLQVTWLEYFSFNWVLMIVCSVHAYKLACQYSSGLTRPWYSKWYGLVSIPVFIIAGIFCMRAFLFEPFRMPSVSMFPTVNPGAILLTKKFGYGNYGTFGITLLKKPVTADVQRGDIVIFEYPQQPTINYVKRIVGLPGDTIEYKDKYLYINGSQVNVSILSESLEFKVWEETLGNTIYKVQNTNQWPARDFNLSVPEGHLFVLGDNRDNSRDSRSWGFVPMQNLVGKPIYIFQ
ncbi:MAG: signal peptidase I [Gammaproteobacteria bacterium]